METADEEEEEEEFQEIDDMFSSLSDKNDKCSIDNIQMTNNVNFKTQDMGNDDEYDIDF